MSYGFFRGGLADLERETLLTEGRAGRRNEDALSGDDSENSSAIRQAAQDAMTVVSHLRAASLKANPEVYARLKADLLPMLARQLAVVGSARQRVPLAAALPQARDQAEALLGRIEAGADSSSVQSPGQQAAPQAAEPPVNLPATRPDQQVSPADVSVSARQTLVPDIQGSLAATLEPGSGALVNRSYLSYGRSGSASESFANTGQPVDAETTSRHHYPARMFSPAMGQVLQPDLYGYDSGANLYPYVDNDPLDFVGLRALTSSLRNSDQDSRSQFTLSDADPDDGWMPNAEYASRSSGRGGSTGALTPAQSMRLHSFTSLHRELHRLVPHHPAAGPSLSGPNWVPTTQQVQSMQAYVVQARKYDAAVQLANREFPHLINKPPEWHHKYPIYYGGHGPTVLLPRPYHQVITNAFREYVKYRIGPPSAVRAQEIMQEVYAKFPLPW